MTRRLNLTAAERHATRWAVSASQAVLDRAGREGRGDTAAIARQAPTSDDLEAALDADVLHDADVPAVLAALSFAASLHEDGMQDIRAVLSPPPLTDMVSAKAKIEASATCPKAARDQA